MKCLCGHFRSTHFNTTEDCFAAAPWGLCRCTAFVAMGSFHPDKHAGVLAREHYLRRLAELEHDSAHADAFTRSGASFFLRRALESEGKSGAVL